MRHSEAGVPGSGVGLLVSRDEFHSGWLRSPKCLRACVGLLMSESRTCGVPGLLSAYWWAGPGSRGIPG